MLMLAISLERDYFEGMRVKAEKYEIIKETTSTYKVYKENSDKDIDEDKNPHISKDEDGTEKVETVRKDLLNKLEFNEFTFGTNCRRCGFIALKAWVLVEEETNIDSVINEYETKLIRKAKEEIKDRNKTLKLLYQEVDQLESISRPTIAV